MVHWTGRAKTHDQAFLALSSICADHLLRLLYCPIYVQKDFRPQNRMVCFTDIPLEFSAQHCSRFGKFGIAFKKQNMIKYGANPVFYTTEAHLARVKHLSTLLAKMRDMEKDRELKSALEPYYFTEDETVAFIGILGFLQEYSYKNSDTASDLTYYQREWRLTFNILPFRSGDGQISPGSASFESKNGISYPIFKFAAVDVDSIIVPRAFSDRAKEFVDKLQCRLIIYEDVIRT